MRKPNKNATALKKGSKDWSVFIVFVGWEEKTEALEGGRPADLHTIIRFSGSLAAVKNKGAGKREILVRGHGVSLEKEKIPALTAEACPW
jgi:hypothetical protein